MTPESREDLQAIIARAAEALEREERKKPILYRCMCCRRIAEKRGDPLFDAPEWFLEKIDPMVYFSDDICEDCWGPYRERQGKAPMPYPEGDGD